MPPDQLNMFIGSLTRDPTPILLFAGMILTFTYKVLALFQDSIRDLLGRLAEFVAPGIRLKFRPREPKPKTSRKPRAKGIKHDVSL